MLNDNDILTLRGQPVTLENPPWQAFWVFQSQATGHMVSQDTFFQTLDQAVLLTQNSPRSTWSQVPLMQTFSVLETRCECVA